MMFNTHDTDGLVLADIRELLYVIACQNASPNNEFRMRDFERRRMTAPPVTNTITTGGV